MSLREFLGISSCQGIPHELHPNMTIMKDGVSLNGNNVYIFTTKLLHFCKFYVELSITQILPHEIKNYTHFTSKSNYKQCGNDANVKFLSVQGGIYITF